MRMPWPFRQAGTQAGGFPGGREDRRQTMLLEALRDLAVGRRGVIYDVPASERPRTVPGSIFVRGGAAWRRFLDAREAVDAGEPTLLISLRVLDEAERHLVVDWGTTYANTFLLVEPRDWRCDLTDPENTFSHRLDDAMDASVALAPPGDAVATVGWTRGTPLSGLLHEAYGVWRYWTVPSRQGVTRSIPLDLGEAGDTLWARLQPILDERFPQASFDRAVARLRASDRELLGGPVARARSVFRTRLGLPVMHDTACVDRAVRHLVDAGSMRVMAASMPGRPIFGAGRPVPAEVTDEEFAGFVMI